MNHKKFISFCYSLQVFPQILCVRESWTPRAAFWWQQVTLTVCFNKKTALLYVSFSLFHLSDAQTEFIEETSWSTWSRFQTKRCRDARKSKSHGQNSQQPLLFTLAAAGNRTMSHHAHTHTPARAHTHTAVIRQRRWRNTPLGFQIIRLPGNLKHLDPSGMPKLLVSHGNGSLRGMRAQRQSMLGAVIFADVQMCWF